MKKDNKNIVLFLILAFLLPFLSVLMQSMIRNEILRFIMYGIQAVSPTIAALILLCLNKESTSFFKNIFHKQHLVFACLFPMAFACITMLLAKYIVCVWLQVDFVIGSISTVQFIIILWALVAEEIGWRGYLQPLFKKIGISEKIVPFLIGIIWCLWHYHYYIQDELQIPILLFLVSCIIESYIYSYLMYFTKGNILSAMTYHFSWNLWIHIWLINPIDNQGSLLPYAVMVFIEFICVLVFNFIKKKNCILKISEVDLCKKN
ncbi:MAG: CPBP family intramembrane glutamic endopeptidase [Longicatena sp.]